MSSSILHPLQLNSTVGEENNIEERLTTFHSLVQEISDYHRADDFLKFSKHRTTGYECVFEICTRNIFTFERDTLDLIPSVVATPSARPTALPSATFIDRPDATKLGHSWPGLPTSFVRSFVPSSVPSFVGLFGASSSRLYSVLPDIHRLYIVYTPMLCLLAVARPIFHPPRRQLSRSTIENYTNLSWRDFLLPWLTKLEHFFLLIFVNILRALYREHFREFH